MQHDEVGLGCQPSDDEMSFSDRLSIESDITQQTSKSVAKLRSGLPVSFHSEESDDDAISFWLQLLADRIARNAIEGEDLARFVASLKLSPRCSF